jgi:hypothetical protein
MMKWDTPMISIPTSLGFEFHEAVLNSHYSRAKSFVTMSQVPVAAGQTFY